jgi:hypothetical protein
MVRRLENIDSLDDARRPLSGAWPRRHLKAARKFDPIPADRRISHMRARAIPSRSLPAGPGARQLLQGAVALAAAVPVAAGLAGVAAGAPGEGAAFDSHYRYLSGLLLGIGLTFWSLIPRIERSGALFRALTLIVVAGGLARLYALWARGDPGVMGLALVMELAVTPALCLWQARIAEAGPEGSA